MHGTDNATRDLWFGTKGPQNAKIVVVAESWGEEEAKYKIPLVGTSGFTLDMMLKECGINKSEVLFTNVIAERPHGNETWRFFNPKNTPNAKRIAGLLPSSFVSGEVRRLYGQLTSAPRSLVIATGNWALWALTKCTGSEVIRESNNRRVPEELQTYGPNGIMNWRGSMLFCDPHPEFAQDQPGMLEVLKRTRLLPIIHPAAIQRAWYLRSPTTHDLKTRVPMALRGDWRTQLVTYSPPTYEVAIGTLEAWLNRAAKESFDLVSDIETFARRFISVMGFSDSPVFAMAIPFVRPTPAGLESYWSVDQEAHIVSLVRRVLSHPRIRIIGQNYIYDTQFIQHWLGVIPNLDFDTMLAQNVIFPGTPKDLSYLSSLYCKYHWYWKDDVKDWGKITNLQSLLDYNCIDCMRTFEIAVNQKALIESLGQEEQMKFKMETNRLCLRMMYRGVKVDSQRTATMLYELQDALARFYSELLEIIPQDMVQPHTKKTDKFWYRSPKQTQELFYNILGMNTVNNRKTGRPTIGKEALMVLERKHPEFTGIFRRLDYAGSVDNTVGVIQTPLEPDGRMRCSYNPGGTETHRLSSSENVWGRGTNLQNLTKGEEDD